jgi:hypothetical protein
MDQLVAANTFNSKVEEENILGSEDEEEGEGLDKTHLGDTRTYSSEEKEKPTTTRLEMDKEAEELVTTEK